MERALPMIVHAHFLTQKHYLTAGFIAEESTSRSYYDLILGLAESHRFRAFQNRPAFFQSHRKCFRFHSFYAILHHERLYF